ncbi:MAG: hypothetical protein RLZZ505_2199 [Verrucomicrobiota bacterium]|jgi:hypothetical protein
MNDSTSLDRLHDLALPPEVPWWPPAPGWYVAIALILVLLTLTIFRAVRRWQANAYRRAALHELKSLETPAAIAELLRRTALAVSPRPLIAELTGPAWPDWLTAHCPEPMPELVRTQLTAGIYQAPSANPNLAPLKTYATRWITHHNRQSSISDLH